MAVQEETADLARQIQKLSERLAALELQSRSCEPRHGDTNGEGPVSLQSQKGLDGGWMRVEGMKHPARAESNPVEEPRGKAEPVFSGKGAVLDPEKIAREAGLWARLSLANKHRGPCPRRKLNEGNNYYVALSSYEGEEFQVAKLYGCWSEAARELQREKQGDYGKATFVGWPSLHLAKIFCEAAGCRWPLAQ
jgi:hypothetical protein